MQKVPLHFCSLQALVFDEMELSDHNNAAIVSLLQNTMVWEITQNHIEILEQKTGLGWLKV